MFVEMYVFYLLYVYILVYVLESLPKFKRFVLISLQNFC